jgi:hypothetical protein
MHGGSRTAEAARDIGAAYGRRHDAIVLAPEFSERYYPGDADAFRKMIDSAGRLLPGLTTPTYGIVGHSAGGQFVHRLRLMRLSLAWARKHRCIAVLRLGYV